MNINELRSAIATALADQIGSYIFSQGLSTQALRIDDGSEPYPEDPEVQGLEVVIRPEVRVSQSLRLGGDRIQSRRHEVVLKQWDINRTTKAARDALLLVLPVEGEAPIVPRSSALDTLETCTLTIEE